MLTLLLRGLIRGYQLLISPVLGPSCRYLPTCSDYAAEAIARHGALAGMWLALAICIKISAFFCVTDRGISRSTSVNGQK